MKRLSRYRRHKAAGPFLLVLALMAIGATFSVATAVTAETTQVVDRSAQIEEGRQIFLKGCSSCHGLNAEGALIAPSLIGVGAASVDFQVGTGRMPMADMSTQAMRKKPIYNAEETAALAAYVASLAPGPEIPTESSLNYERDGNTAEGGELFRNNCAMCHNFAGQGGALAQVVIQAVMLMLTAPVLLFYLLHLMAVVELAVVETLLMEILVNQVDQVALVREVMVLALVIPLLHLHHKVILALQVVGFKVAAAVALAVAEVAV